MSKVPAGIALGEIETAIREIDTITAIMGTIGKYAQQDEIQPEWFVFLGRAIDDITQRVDDVMGRSA